MITLQITDPSSRQRGHPTWRRKKVIVTQRSVKSGHLPQRGRPRWTGWLTVGCNITSTSARHSVNSNASPTASLHWRTRSTSKPPSTSRHQEPLPDYCYRSYASLAVFIAATQPVSAISIAATRPKQAVFPATTQPRTRYENAPFQGSHKHSGAWYYRLYPLSGSLDNYKTRCFGNWICFHFWVKSARHLLCWVP
jgi:hypothetical protein